MNLQQLSVDEWQQLDDDQAETLARELVTELPQLIKFRRVVTHRFNQKSYRVAYFEYDDSLFVLVPGGEAEIGFEASTFSPTPEQVTSFEVSKANLGLETTFHDYIQQVTTPLRSVSFECMLVEVAAFPIGLASLGSGLMYDTLVDALATKGLRLLTFDEWEYVCGAGATTLFRWGNTCPSDHYPITRLVNANRLKHQWIQTGQLLQLEPDDPTWDIHLKSNPFGLKIAQNPYNCEVVGELSDPDSFIQIPKVRGGDGGAIIHSEYGYFLGWLTLATAYWQPELLHWVDEDLRDCSVRRVIPFP